MLDLLAARGNDLLETDHLGMVTVDSDSARLEEVMVDEKPLRAAQAANRLGISTKELVRLVYTRRIRYVMINGIAHIPSDAVEDYQRHAG